MTPWKKSCGRPCLYLSYKLFLHCYAAAGKILIDTSRLCGIAEVLVIHTRLSRILCALFTTNVLLTLILRNTELLIRCTELTILRSLSTFTLYITLLLLGNRVVSVLDSGAEEPGFKSQSRRCRVTVLGKLFTPIVPLCTKQRNR